MNLHDELGRHGADAVEDSAQRLSSSGVRSSLSSRVRRGRRRRAVGGGVGAVAGIALVGVGVWGVLPGLGFDAGPADPAGTPWAAIEETTYEVDSSAPVDPDLAIDLRRQEFLECGIDFDLEPGVTVHDTAVIDAGLEATARPVVYRYDDSYGAAPTSIAVGDEDMRFPHYETGDDVRGITVFSVPLVLSGGQTVSTGFVEEWIAPDPDEGREAVVSSPGECVGTESAGHSGDGMYEPVLVTQVWSDDLQEPLATIVFSAGEIEYTGLGGPEVEDADSLGNTWSDDALASVIEARERTYGLLCAALLSDQAFATGPLDAGDVVGSIPVPSTIETGRLYGYGDDALVGGYPIPVNRADGATDPLDRMTTNGEMRLVLREGGESWVFDAVWTERDDLPHDEPGWFVELNQVWDCGSPDLIEPGEYSASLVVPELEKVYDLTPITVVSGVPSIPEIDAQG